MLGPVASPSENVLYRDAVNDHRDEVELAGPPVQSQQLGMESVPGPDLLPGPLPAVRDASGAAAFGRFVLPLGPGSQLEPDHPDRPEVPERGPTAPGSDGRSVGR